MEPEINKKLLYAVAEHIELHPETYRQSEWASVGDAADPGPWFNTVLDAREALRQRLAAGQTCGTHACVAGWAIALASDEDWDSIQHRVIDGSFSQTARLLLGLDLDTAYSLFDGGRSPQGTPDLLRDIAENGTRS